MKITKQMLREMIEDVMSEEIDEVSLGMKDGKAFADASDERSIKDQEYHWNIVNSAVEGESDDYRSGFIMGYSSRYNLFPSKERPEEWGTDLEGVPGGLKFKSSPPVNRDFEK